MFIETFQHCYDFIIHLVVCFINNKMYLNIILFKFYSCYKNLFSIDFLLIEKWYIERCIKHNNPLKLQTKIILNI